VTELDAAHYSAVESLRDGRSVEIRALRPEDRGDLVAAIGRVSAQSLYRRFFSAKRNFSEQETSFFVDIDFVGHVALVAVLEGESRHTIVAGGRYIVAAPGQAEVAFVVVDAYQGQGLGSALLRHLTAIARSAGLRELTADVLAENAAMLGVFNKSGLPLRTTRERSTVHIVLQLT